MLTSDQKVMILKRAGWVVPPFPACTSSLQQLVTCDAQAGNSDAGPGNLVERQVAAKDWAQIIEGLYIALQKRTGG
jgi:hypothetical protein